MFFITENQLSLPADPGAEQIIEIYWGLSNYIIKKFTSCYIRVDNEDRINSNDWNKLIAFDKDELENVQYYAGYHGYDSSKLISILSEKRHVKEVRKVPAYKISGHGIVNQIFLLIEDAATLFSFIYSSNTFRFDDLYSSDIKFELLFEFNFFISSVSKELTSIQLKKVDILDCFKQVVFRDIEKEVVNNYLPLLNSIEHESSKLCSFYLLENFPNNDDDTRLAIFHKNCHARTTDSSIFS